MNAKDRSKALRVIWVAVSAVLGFASIVGTSNSERSDLPGDSTPPVTVPTSEVVTVQYPVVALDGTGGATIAHYEITTRQTGTQFPEQRETVRMLRYDILTDSYSDGTTQDDVGSGRLVVAADESHTSFVALTDTRLCRHAVPSGWSCEVRPGGLGALAMDGSGRALSFGGSTAVVAHFTPAIGWGPAQALSSGRKLGSIERGHLVYWNGGAGYAIWAETNGEVRARRFRRDAGEAWEPPLALGTVHEQEQPSVALARNALNAGALAAWVAPTLEVRFSRFIPGESWTAPAAIPNSASAGLGNVKVFMSANGDALLVGTRSGELAAMRYINGTWEPSQTLGQMGDPEFRAAMDGAGNGIVVWRRAQRLIANRFLAGSGWNGEEQIAVIPGPTEQGFDVDMDDAGRALIVSTRDGPSSLGGTRLRVDAFGLFDLTAAPAAIDVAHNGGTGSVAFKLARRSHQGAITLRVLDCPAKVSCTLSRTEIPAGDNADTTLTFSTSAADPAAVGSYNARIEAIGGLQTSTSVARLTVQGPSPNVVLTLQVIGNGHVTIFPTIITDECVGPQVCTQSLPRNTAVTLFAVAATGYGFTGYSGANCSGVAFSISFTIAADMTCTVTFTNEVIPFEWRIQGTSGVNRLPPTEAANIEKTAIEPGPDGLPVIAFAENNTLVVRRWNGVEWQDLGTSPTTGEVLSATLTFETQGGAPVVAWDEVDSTVTNGTRNAYAARWDGSGWNRLGDGPLDVDDAADAASPAIRARSTDLVVAWSESLNTGGSQIVVRAWNGTAWVNAGTSQGPPATPALDNTLPRLAVGPADELAVAWVEGFLSVLVAELQNGVWTKTATPPLPPGQFGSEISSLDIAYTNGFGLIFAAQPPVGGPFQVRRWSDGAWSDLGPPRGLPNGTIFGVAFSHHRTGHMPLLAHARRTVSVHQFIVERFGGTDWLQVGEPIEPLDRRGRPGFEFRVSMAIGGVTYVATTVISVLPTPPSSRDDSVVVYGFR